MPKCEFCNNLASYEFKDENKARFCNIFHCQLKKLY